MMTKVWAVTRGYSKGVKIEQHRFSSGEEFYSFRDRFGRPYDLRNEEEAMALVKQYRMEDVTEQMTKFGWID